MCCFSVPTPTGFLQKLFTRKVHVSATNVFGRMTAAGVQALAYSMNLSSEREVAMILPIPVRPGTGEDAVRFVDLEKYPNMFDELADLFEMPLPLPFSRGAASVAAAPRPKLVVHKVGAFIASYVPSRFDFDRLDRRFWLPRVLIESVPAYSDYGFAVFQLEPGKTTVHPMAFTFPTREIDRLFFPTVHLHDGQFRREAEFDHAIYYQHPRVKQQGGAYEGDQVAYLMPQTDYGGLVDKSQPILRRNLHGKLPNIDTWIKTGRPITVGPV